MHARYAGRPSQRKPEMQYLFIHINKTGGSSIEKALGLPFRHLTAREYIRMYGLDTWNRSFKFTVIRNPWDKVVSHYHYRVMTNQTDLASSPISFNEWVKRAYGERDPQYYDQPKMFMPQVKWLIDHEDQIRLNQIIRFETLDKGFRKLCRTLGVHATLPHLKSSRRGHYREYYDKPTIEIVRDWFAEDIETFNYRF